MTKKIRRLISILAAVITTAAVLSIPVITFADADISMTTSTGTVEVTDEIEVTVRISSDEQIGTYFIELEYDSSRMRYVKGADKEQDGILTLTGTGMSRNIRYDLKFTGAIGGEAGIIVRNALVNNSAGSAVNTTDSGMLQIIVSGQGDNSASFTQKLAEEDELFDGGLPIAGTIHDPDGNTLYVVDLTRTTPDALFFPVDLKEEMFEGQMLTFATDKDGVIKMIPLTDADDNVALYAVNGDMFYPMTDYTDPNGNRFAYVSLEACPTMPQKIASDTEMWDYAVYAVSKSGTGGFYLINGQGGLELYTVLNSTTLVGAGLFSKVFSGNPIPWERYLTIAAIIIVLIIILVIILSIVLKSLKKRKIRKVAEYQYDYSVEEPVSVDEDINDIDVIVKREDALKAAETAPVSRRAKSGQDIHQPGKNVVRVDDLSTVDIKRKEEPAETSLPESEPETGEDELLSLDDIVLTAEDVPDNPDDINKTVEDAAESEETGTGSISVSEPEEAADEMAKTIRIEKIVVEDEENS